MHRSPPQKYSVREMGGCLEVGKQSFRAQASVDITESLCMLAQGEWSMEMDLKGSELQQQYWLD